MRTDYAVATDHMVSNNCCAYWLDLRRKFLRFVTLTAFCNEFTLKKSNYIAHNGGKFCMFALVLESLVFFSLGVYTFWFLSEILYSYHSHALWELSPKTNKKKDKRTFGYLCRQEYITTQDRNIICCSFHFIRREIWVHIRIMQAT